MDFETQLYLEQSKSWPRRGNHIMANYDANSIIVYQAYKSELSRAILECQNFHDVKCIEAGYSLTRTTWLKTNFLWMMHRSGWAHKHNQERVLAIRLKREGFDQILGNVLKVVSGVKNLEKHISVDWKPPEKPIRKVILQWDPDHAPDGEAIKERRALQLGLRNEMLLKFSQEFVVSIVDVTEFVLEQYERCKVRDRPFRDLTRLETPLEREYVPSSLDICKHIYLTI